MHGRLAGPGTWVATRTLLNGRKEVGGWPRKEEPDICAARRKKRIACTMRLRQLGTIEAFGLLTHASSDKSLVGVAAAMTRKARTCTIQGHKSLRTSGVGRTAKAMPLPDERLRTTCEDH